MPVWFQASHAQNLGEGEADDFQGRGKGHEYDIFFGVKSEGRRLEVDGLHRAHPEHPDFEADGDQRRPPQIIATLRSLEPNCSENFNVR